MCVYKCTPTFHIWMVSSLRRKEHRQWLKPEESGFSPLRGWPADLVPGEGSRPGLGAAALSLCPHRELALPSLVGY